MTPGSNPLPPLAATTGEAPAGFPQSSRQGFNLHDPLDREGVIITESGDQRGDQVADRARLVFVDVGRSGFAAHFLHIPFHGGCCD